MMKYFAMILYGKNGSKKFNIFDVSVTRIEKTDSLKTHDAFAS